MSFLVTHTPHISASVLTTGGLTGPNLMNGGYGSFLEDDGGATADKVHMQAVATGGTVYVYDFSVTTKQLTLAGSYAMPISSGSNANSVHLASNNFILSWRTSSLTAFCRGEEQDDTGYGDVTSDITEGSEHYVNAYRLGDTNAISQNNSNEPQIASRQLTYVSGTSIVKSALSSAGKTSYHVGRSVVGGGGGSIRARGADPKRYMTVNFPEHTNYSYDATTRNLDVLLFKWDGVEGNANARSTTATAVVLPVHTNSTKAPDHITTTYGNLLIHHDTNTPANANLYKITWSGDTPSVGSPVDWGYPSTYPTHEIYWAGLDGYGQYGAGKMSAGEVVDDVWNTIRVYESGGDVLVDTIQISVDSNLNHTVKLVHEAVITISSSSDTDFGHPIFNLNGKDLALFHAGNDTFYYIEDAYT